VCVVSLAADGSERGTPAPLARSPLPLVGQPRPHHGWLSASRTSVARLQLADLSSVSKLLVRAAVQGTDGGRLPPFGRALRNGDLLQVGSGPGEWLLLSSSRSAKELTDDTLRAVGTEFVSVVDVTHGRAMVRLTGPQSAVLLSAICEVNLADSVMPNAGAFRSSMAGIVTDAIRDDRDGVRSYLLHCERSTGRSLVEMLLDAGEEYDCDYVGSADL
jgi:heterotetrameric sarcosine oxidase gamma subunit